MRTHLVYIGLVIISSLLSYHYAQLQGGSVEVSKGGTKQNPDTPVPNTRQVGPANMDDREDGDYLSSVDMPGRDVKENVQPYEVTVAEFDTASNIVEGQNDEEEFSNQLSNFFTLEEDMAQSLYIQELNCESGVCSIKLEIFGEGKINKSNFGIVIGHKLQQFGRGDHAYSFNFMPDEEGYYSIKVGKEAGSLKGLLEQDSE